MANSQTVAFSYLYQDKILFLNHDLDEIVTVKGKDSKVFIDSDDTNSIIYYLSGYAGKDKFYFKNIGCTSNELDEGKKKTSIEVFDNKGTPLFKYYLDNFVYCFVVDENNNKLYAYGYDDDVLLVYDIDE